MSEVSEVSEVWEGLLKVLPSLPPLPPLPTVPTLPPLSLWSLLKKKNNFSQGKTHPLPRSAGEICGGLGVGHLPIRASYWSKPWATFPKSKAYPMPARSLREKFFFFDWEKPPC
ncbi:MAG: hypothetical protein F6J93_08900 [Oscillatoria sp. SIO1A7]|nr:hypothetical protein [Oscillatoria sp. SIO1A7]